MRQVTLFFDRMVQRYLPDPFLFAAILTFVVFGLGLALTESTAVQMVQYWGDGFWKLLSFSMQMVLILVTGHVLANSPIFKKGLGSLAQAAKTPGQAILLVSIVSLLASWINWGFGLVIGAVFARQIVRAVPTVDYRLLIASAYSGFLVWHGGLSGSVPLTIATEDHFAKDLIGVIPTAETIFAPFNLFILAALLVILPLLNRLMLNYTDGTVKVNADLLADKEEAEERLENPTPADRLENSMWLSVITALLGLFFVYLYFRDNGFKLNLDIVNFTFLFLGILLHKTPRRFLNAVLDAVKGAGGIIVQFPFYAGIMGMMVASGLAKEMSEWFVSIANETTFPLLTFLSAGLVNFFVPSGGGQWAVQAPVMLPAGAALGVDAAKTAMAVAWGDAWTNMIQPFWALPALAIAGLRAKDIMGFCIVTLLVSGAVISLGFLLF